MFWTGHAGRDVHDGYVKLGKEIEARKTWAFKAGLNFELPTRQATDAEVVEVEIQALVRHVDSVLRGFRSEIVPLC